MDRLSWDDYFMQVCEAVALRATCDRGRSGAVIAKEGQILATGYVGSPSKLPHCDEVGHNLKTIIHSDGHQSTHCMRTVHAEQNAIAQAAKHGVAIAGATIYCRMTPCRICAMLIINCGLKRVVAQWRYHDAQESEQILAAAGISLDYIHKQELVYS